MEKGGDFSTLIMGIRAMTIVEKGGDFSTILTAYISPHGKSKIYHMEKHYYN